MRNPFRSEAAAFRFLLLTLLAFAAIALTATAAGRTAAIAVWALASVLAIIAYARRGRPARRLATAPAHRGAPQERRLLLVAEEPPAAPALEALARRADRVLVVSPAVTSRLRRWLSDSDDARAHARARADAAVAQLRAANIDASGIVADDDPIRAVEDALRTFGGDEIAVATDDDAVVASLREHYALPVTHLGA